MQPKPDYFGALYAETFQQQSVVEVYRYRPPYPAEVFDILAELVTSEPRAVLDVGAGSGDIARPLASRVERVDAVDFSQQMIATGRQLPGGDHPHLHWIYGRVEEAPLTPPYALVTAGSSIHWMDWNTVFQRFHDVLVPGGYLALIYRHTRPVPWEEELRAIRFQFGRQRPRAANVFEELQTRGLFLQQGHRETAPIPFEQSIDDFIEGMHSRSSCSKVLMEPEQVAEFDRLVRDMLTRYAPDGMLHLEVVGTVTWGRPLAAVFATEG